MEIYIARNGQRSGPFPLEEVRLQLAAGKLFAYDLAWAQGAADWAPLSSFPGLVPEASQTTIPATLLGTLNTVPSPPGLAASRPQQTSGAAVASLIAGILSLLVVPILGSVVAIICGHVARSNIRSSRGALTGDGMAVAGLIMGYGGLCFFVLISMIAILAGIALPVFSEVKLRASETQSLANAKTIATACKLYARDHNGAFPAKLDELVPDYLPDRVDFVSTLSPGESVAYYYYGGKDTDPANNVLLMSKFKDKRGKRIIIHVDTSGLLGIPPPNLLPPPDQ
jgi:hypothetical protein